MNTMDEKFEGWIANLSDGRTIKEEPEVPGELSPWRKLINFCQENNLYLTNLRLVFNGTNLICIPHADGYCQINFEFRNIFRKERYIKRGIGTVIKDKIYVLWVDESRNVTLEILNLEQNRVHCILNENKNNE